MSSNHGAPGDPNDPEYDWMEVLDNFLGSDDYEGSDKSDRNETGHQLNTQTHDINASERPNVSQQISSSFLSILSSNPQKNVQVEQNLRPENYSTATSTTYSSTNSIQISKEVESNKISQSNPSNISSRTGNHTEQIQPQSNFFHQADNSQHENQTIPCTGPSSRPGMCTATGISEISRISDENRSTDHLPVCTSIVNTTTVQVHTQGGITAEHSTNITQTEPQNPNISNTISQQIEFPHENSQELSSEPTEPTFPLTNNTLTDLETCKTSNLDNIGLPSQNQTNLHNIPSAISTSTTLESGVPGVSSAFNKLVEKNESNISNFTSTCSGDSQTYNDANFIPIQNALNAEIQTETDITKCINSTENVPPKPLDDTEKCLNDGDMYNYTNNNVENGNQNLQNDVNCDSTGFPESEKTKVLEDSEPKSTTTTGTEDSQAVEKNTTATYVPYYYQPMYFAPVCGFYWGNMNQSYGSDSKDNTVQSKVDKPKSSVEVDVEKVDSVNQQGQNLENKINPAIGKQNDTPDSNSMANESLPKDSTHSSNQNCEKEKKSETSENEKTPNNLAQNGSDSCSSNLEKSVTGTTISKSTVCNVSTGTGTKNSDSKSSKITEPRISYPTIAKIPARKNSDQSKRVIIAPKTKKPRIRYSQVPLLPCLESSKISPLPSTPLSSLSKLSVPCPIFVPSSDVSKSSSDTQKDNSSTRAEPTTSTLQIKEERDDTCQTAGSTSTMSNDNTLHADLDFPENDGLGTLDIESKVQARSERKRNREKQRRTDVNAQFAALTSLLRRVEAEDLESDADTEEDDDDSADPDNKSKKRKKCSLSVIGALGQGSPSNRVDLIARTITVMDRLHELSAKRRTEVRKLKKQLKTAKTTDEVTDKVTAVPVQVPSAAGAQMMPMNAPSMMMSPGKDGQQPFMMMVPMMMGPDGQPQGGGMPAAPMPLPMQFMGQQCYPMQPPPQGQQVKMPPQGMQMMPPGMYPGQPPQGASRPVSSPGPVQGQMMSMYGGGMPGMPRMSPHPAGPRPPHPNSPIPPGSSGRSQQKKNIGGDLAHCA